MQSRHHTPYLHLVSDTPNPMADAAPILLVTADRAIGAGQGSVFATLEQIKDELHEASGYYFDYDGDAVGEDGDIATLDAVEALGRALIAVARKARKTQQGTPAPRRPRRPHVIS